MKQTAVEWFGKKVLDVITTDEFNKLLEQAKEMEKEQVHKYAEFAIRCDREGLPTLEFDGYINLEKK